MAPAPRCATQVPVGQWHARIGDPTIADAILDLPLHGAHRIEVRGESMRELHALLEGTPPPADTAADQEPSASRAQGWQTARRASKRGQGGGDMRPPLG